MSTEDKIAELMDAIGDYWNLAYAEGKEGRTHDTEDGAAARKLHEIQSLARDLAGPTQEDLRRLVAEVWRYVGFDPSVPEHVADALITKALGAKGRFE